MIKLSTYQNKTRVCVASASDFPVLILTVGYCCTQDVSPTRTGQMVDQHLFLYILLDAKGGRFLRHLKRYVNF